MTSTGTGIILKKGDPIMEENKVIVRNEVVVNAAPATCFIYCCLCFAFAASLLGFIENAGLAIAVLQLSVFVGYTIGSVFILKSGSGIGGNTFFIFAALFAGTGGMLGIAQAICEHVGYPFSSQIGALVNVISGLFLFVILYANRINAKTDFFTILFASIGVFCCGLSGFVAPKMMSLIAGISLGIDGIVVFYSSSIQFLEMSGVKVNYGKPFVTPDKK